MITDSNIETSPIAYLSLAAKLLSNPSKAAEGRDMVIRALDKRSDYRKYDSLLKHLVRKAGLFPYLNSEFKFHDIEDLISIEANKPNRNGEIVFHATQTRVFNELAKGNNVVLSAPTSMGKSEILANILNPERYSKIVLIVPTIALIDETRKKLTKTIGNKYKVIHHNSQVYDKTKPTIFILTQERANQRNDFDNVDLFILDEFYKLGFKYDSNGTLKYDERAISLNISLSKLLKMSSQWFFIGPNINNVKGLSSLVGDFTFICSDFRTVSVDIKEYDIAAKDIELKQKTLIEVLKQCNGEKTIIYCRSPNAANQLAKFLMTDSSFSSNFDGEYIRWLSETYDPRWSYCKSLKSGVVLHHGVLPRALQHFSIDIFNRSRRHNVLICTSTIIEGVNTTAKNVVIYENYNGIGVIDKFTHNNIKGRAGRMYQHFVGNVFCLQTQPKDDDSDELIVPIGDDNSGCPLNLLGAIEIQHLSAGDRASWESYEKTTKIPIQIIKNNSSFEVDKIEVLFVTLSNLLTSDFELYKELNFFGKPTTRALYFIMKCFIEAKKSILTRNGFSVTSKNGNDPISSICGKFRAYISAGSVDEYLREQMTWKHEQLVKEKRKEKEIEEVMSEVIDTELKRITNVYGFSFPNYLSLFSDILYHLNSKEQVDLNFDYSPLISDLEFQKLTAGYSALHEMGVPHQTLEKIRSYLKEVDETSVDEVIKEIKLKYTSMDFLNTVDRYFIEAAKL
jgi:hypothetical protein